MAFDGSRISQQHTEFILQRINSLGLLQIYDYHSVTMLAGSVRRSGRPDSEDKGKGVAFDPGISNEDRLDSSQRGSGCLEKIYPRNDEETDFDSLRLIDSVADIFMSSLSSKESIKMSSSAFRIFCR